MGQRITAPHYFLPPRAGEVASETSRRGIVHHLDASSTALRAVPSPASGEDEIHHSICGILALAISSLKNGTFLAMRSRTASGPAATGA